MSSTKIKLTAANLLWFLISDKIIGHNFPISDFIFLKDFIFISLCANIVKVYSNPRNGYKNNQNVWIREHSIAPNR